MTLQEEVIFLREENRLLREIIDKLEKRISVLEDELRRARHIKNSSNSSKPPSTDISAPKRNQSLREQSGNKTGGQFGHKGTTLQMSDKPNEVIELKPDYCNNCGCALETEEAELISRRQVVDIPLVRPIITEYRNYKRVCPKCGRQQNQLFYQPRIIGALKPLTTYFLTALRMPF